VRIKPLYPARHPRLNRSERDQTVLGTVAVRGRMLEEIGKDKTLRF
jgi:hypothetical protein